MNVIAEGNTDLSFQTNGAMGDIVLNNVPATATLNLNITAGAGGNVLVNANPGDKPALALTSTGTSLGNITAPGNLTLTANALQSVGSILVGGNAVLKAAALTTAGNLNVTGSLNLNQGLPVLSRIGTFKAGSLSATSKNLMIGSKSIKGSVIGAIQIGSIAKGKGLYEFAFSLYTGTPNAVIGGKSGTAKTGAGLNLNGAKLILTPGLTVANVKVAKAKSVARTK